jgi:hypothetical protein
VLLPGLQVPEAQQADGHALHEEQQQQRDNDG